MKEFFDKICIISKQSKEKMLEEIQPKLISAIKEQIEYAACNGKFYVDIIPMLRVHGLQTINQIDSVRDSFIQAGFTVATVSSMSGKIEKEGISWKVSNLVQEFREDIKKTSNNIVEALRALGTADKRKLSRAVHAYGPKLDQALDFAISSGAVKLNAKLYSI